MTVQANATTLPRYAFLAHPPPSKKQPTSKLPPTPPMAGMMPTTLDGPMPVSMKPTRKRSTTFTHITSWAHGVQPGTPVPCSPHRRSSVSKRRGSIRYHQGPAASFLHIIDTPTTASGPRVSTPLSKDFDLTNLGYTSVFVSLPYTPVTPSPIPVQETKEVVNVESQVPQPKKALKRFRSLGLLRPFRSAASTAPTPNCPPSPAKSHHKPRSPTHVKAKQSKTSKAAKRHGLPPSLANELMLMQFVDGGSIETHAKRAMESQAKAAANYGSIQKSATGVALCGVGDIHRDGKGGVWWDQAEEQEYVHLLKASPSIATSPFSARSWVHFNADTQETSLIITPPPMTVGSIGSQDSELNPHYLVTADDANEVVIFETATRLEKASMLVLNLPPRTKRPAKHLRKGLSTELDPFSGSNIRVGSTASERKRGKARRRPAPIKITQSCSGIHIIRSPLNADAMKRDFINSSFAPAPIILRNTSRSDVRLLFN